MALWGRTKMSGPILAWVAGLVVAGALATVMAHFTVAVLIRHEIARRTFDATQGVVDKSWVEVKHDDDGSSARPMVEYHYTVAGQTHKGSRFTYDAAFRGGGEYWAQQSVDDMPVGSRVTVYYDPADPSDSILQLWEDPSLLMATMLATPFIIGGVALFVGVMLRLVRGDEWAATHEYASRTGQGADLPGWGTLRKEGDTLTLQPRAIKWAKVIVTAVLLCFLVGPSCIFMSGWTLSRQAALNAWWLVGGLMAWIIILQVVLRGPRLEVHFAKRQVRLRSWRRKAYMRFDEIDCWSLRSIRSPAVVGSVLGQSAFLLSARTVDNREIPFQVFPHGRGQSLPARRTQAILADITRSTCDPPNAGPEDILYEAPRRLSPLGLLKCLRLPNIVGWLAYADLC